MSLRGVVLVSFVALGCATGSSDAPQATPGFDTGPGVDGDATVENDASDEGVPDDVSMTLDSAPGDSPPLDPDAACATATEVAKTELLPVDIIWMVDNSSSMEPAVTELKAGLNAFAALIGGKSLDYKVIMLALRSKTSPITISGSIRWPVCIPPPLAGDDNCGNGPRFFHAAVDVKSTQPLEQFIGTLDQTEGYKAGQERGSEPWKAQLRPTATRTIVLVTDHDSRFSATDFETFAGGKNPFNSLTLPPGILHPSRAGMFAGYVFAALYGYGSETDPSVMCMYPDGRYPPASGTVYTTLVKKTGGPRAKLCDGKAAWGPFFDAVASAVTKTAKLSCEVTIPLPSTGTLDPTKVNVHIEGASGTTLVPKVSGAAACGSGPGWYYDDDFAPKKIFLCPASCDLANSAVGVDKPGKISLQFGCKTEIR
ncbi:MAG: hypothetical protein HYV09_33460 [Deltaproteobacteria bacterium]|nr:hypothetical protein [Deltaproteobacteria bacterium]